MIDGDPIRRLTDKNIVQEVSREAIGARLQDLSDSRSADYNEWVHYQYPDGSNMYQDDFEWVQANFPVAKIRDIALRNTFTGEEDISRYIGSIVPVGNSAFSHGQRCAEVSRGVFVEYCRIHYIEQPRDAEKALEIYKKICELLDESRQYSDELSSTSVYPGDGVDTEVTFSEGVTRITSQINELIDHFRASIPRLSGNSRYTGRLVNVMTYVKGRLIASLNIDSFGWGISVSGLPHTSSQVRHMQKVKVLETPPLSTVKDVDSTVEDTADEIERVIE